MRSLAVRRSPAGPPGAGAPAADRAATALGTWDPVWTIGHSTRPIGELLAVLSAYRIELVADVRRFPGSRRLPQYGAEALERSLGEAGIAYRWLPALGGRRRPDPASVNVGWRHPAFRAYADHIAGEEFAEGLFELSMLSQGLRTAIMCSEVLWWRCHRRLIADVLTSLGVPVVHIRDERVAETHRLAAPARLSRGRLTYAAASAAAPLTTHESRTPSTLAPCPSTPASPPSRSAAPRRTPRSAPASRCSSSSVHG